MRGESDEWHRNWWKGNGKSKPIKLNGLWKASMKESLRDTPSVWWLISRTMNALKSDTFSWWPGSNEKDNSASFLHIQSTQTDVLSHFHPTSISPTDPTEMLNFWGFLLWKFIQLICACDVCGAFGTGTMKITCAGKQIHDGERIVDCVTDVKNHHCAFVLSPRSHDVAGVCSNRYFRKQHQSPSNT